MKASRKSRVGACVVLAVGVGLACEPIVATQAPGPPLNACPGHACAAYQPGPTPTCNAGVCIVPATPTNLLLVIGLATDSYLAPGRTYVATLNSASSAPPTCAAPTCCELPNCSPPSCALPEALPEMSAYFITPSAWGNTPNVVNWNLGNKGEVTTLPAQATFRFRFGASVTMSRDALDLGLPVQPVLATNAPMPPLLPHGPNGSMGVQFETYLQPGCYERTLQPFEPFSRAFPPEIKPWPPDTPSDGTYSDFERTEATGEGFPDLPRFDIARREGLEGWTAYLRDVQTKRVSSNVVPLTGSLAPNVTLPTKHLWKVSDGQVVPDTSLDALTGLELVLQPPPGQPLPTEFFVPNVAMSSIPGVPPSLQLSSSLTFPLTYPSLPTPVTVSGRIRTPAGAPVPATIYLTAMDILDRSGQKFPPNFEFSTHVTTVRDAQTGASTYSALLPQGDYQIVVRPTDGDSAVKSAVRPVGGQGNDMTGEDFDVTPLVPLSGKAVVADGRALAEAIVEALPTQCYASEGDAAAPADSSDACLPNAAQTVTADDGSFRLLVDPGGYRLRVRPRDGSRLPWKSSSIAVGTSPRVVSTVVIPAPMSVGMRLTDSASKDIHNPLLNAVVRVFTDPPLGKTAIELGRAITDFDGNYEMYIALPDP
jgi:hypothetical protein